jgi:hypothetical protein
MCILAVSADDTQLWRVMSSPEQFLASANIAVPSDGADGQTNSPFPCGEKGKELESYFPI